MTREQSLDFNLWMVAIVLVVSSIVLIAATWRSVAGFAWVLLGFFAVLIGFLLSVNQAVINYNARGTPIHPGRIVLILAIAVAALIAAYLLLHRQAPLPEGETLTIETHASRAWSMVILIAMAGPIIAMALAPRAVFIPMLLVLARWHVRLRHGLGRISIPIYAARPRYSHARFAASFHSAIGHRELCDRALGLHSRLRNSRYWERHARMCGATRWCTSRPPMGTFISATTNPRVSSATWIG